MTMLSNAAITPSPLISRRQGILLALLAVLYLILWLGPDTPLGRTFVVVHLGLFMLWQPFVNAEQRVSVISMIGLAAVLLLVGLFLKGWMIALWIMMLAGIVGGKVLLFGARAPRLFNLMALGFLVMALLLMAAPIAVPIVRPPRTILLLGYLGLPLILVTMALLPGERETDAGREVVDFVYSLFVFLLLAVLMLGTLASMLLLNSGYVEALLQTLMVTGVMLLILGLAWNPHSGFSGLGGLFLRYLMSIGLPIEQWLQALTNLALREDDPKAFLEQACVEIGKRLPWVTGAEWIAGRDTGGFGETGGRRWEFSHGGMVLVLYTLDTLSPTLVWHCNLLAQLLAQFHADKQRAQALKQLSHMQAVHETGARLTHDVKNLLQSLNALCSAGMETGADESPEYQSLLRRQLPAISERLAETLVKLSSPTSLLTSRSIPAEAWWHDLRQRTATMDWMELAASEPIGGELPAEVFSGFADNQIRNVIEKRAREPALRVRVELNCNGDDFELLISDDGSAIADDVASNLFVGPLPSESGYGIGLYQAARYAQSAGYRLELVENRAGRICFRLARASKAS